MHATMKADELEALLALHPMPQGDTESLYISAKHQERDYDFVFTSLNNTAFQVYSGVAHVYSVYDKTRLYRDLNIGGERRQQAQCV
eukprot:1151021-Pelagomonas_calceolata.AAC.1